MKLDDMQVYKDSVELAKLYRGLHKIMSRDDQFSIGQQMLRSSVSIASNIAEGIGKESTTKNLLVFLGHSRGSLYEFKTQLEIVRADYSSHGIIEVLQKKTQLVEDGLYRFTTFLERHGENK